MTSFYNYNTRNEVETVAFGQTSLRKSLISWKPEVGTGNGSWHRVPWEILRGGHLGHFRPNSVISSSKMKKIGSMPKNWQKPAYGLSHFSVTNTHNSSFIRFGFHLWSLFNEKLWCFHYRPFVILSGIIYNWNIPTSILIPRQKISPVQFFS